MKAKREHRVPLSRRAAQILDAARTLGNGGVLIYLGVRGSRVPDMMCSRLPRDLKIGAVPHGFPSSFRDWTAEETNHPREVVEAALAHVIQNNVEAAYARSDLFERLVAADGRLGRLSQTARPERGSRGAGAFARLSGPTASKFGWASLMRQRAYAVCRGRVCWQSAVQVSEFVTPFHLRCMESPAEAHL